MKLIDITGEKFGRLTVICRVKPVPKQRPRWECLCTCGKTVVVAASNLRTGNTRSCGCIAAEWAVELGTRADIVLKRSEGHIVHGHSARGRLSPEYRAWIAMKARCYQESSKDFANWGGRGIKVCERWKSSFESFLSDMGSKPRGASLDRIDPNADYGPQNCRWATIAQQGGENKRSNIRVEVEGEVFDGIAAACRKLGTSVQAAYSRIQAGMPASEAVSIPARKWRRQAR